MFAYTQVNAQKTHILKLTKGDLLLEVLGQYAQEKQIRSGYFSGIGALAIASLNYFDLKKKQYAEKTVHDVELLSCLGNISIHENTNRPIVHAHIAVSDANSQVWGGHAGPTTQVSVTAEIFLVETDGTLWRARDAHFDSNLLNLNHE